MLSTELDPGDPEGEKQIKSCLGSIEGGIKRTEKAQIRSEALEVEGNQRGAQRAELYLFTEEELGFRGGNQLIQGHTADD